MGAGLEGHVERGAASALPGSSQREGFRVRSAGARMEGFAYDATTAHDYATDHGVRVRLALATASEREAAEHEADVGHAQQVSRSS
jgi:hypothetical protein